MYGGRLAEDSDVLHAPDAISKPHSSPFISPLQSYGPAAFCGHRL